MVGPLSPQGYFQTHRETGEWGEGPTAGDTGPSGAQVTCSRSFPQRCSPAQSGLLPGSGSATQDPQGALFRLLPAGEGLPGAWELLLPQPDSLAATLAPIPPRPAPDARGSNDL